MTPKINFYSDEECTQPFLGDFGDVYDGFLDTKYIRNNGDAEIFKMQVKIDSYSEIFLTVKCDKQNLAPGEVSAVRFCWINPSDAVRELNPQIEIVGGYR